MLGRSELESSQLPEEWHMTCTHNKPCCDNTRLMLTVPNSKLQFLEIAAAHKPEGKPVLAGPPRIQASRFQDAGLSRPNPKPWAFSWRHSVILLFVVGSSAGVSGRGRGSTHTGAGNLVIVRKRVSRDCR